MLKPPAIIILLALLTAVRSSQGADSDWKAGFASIKITPDKPVPMAGYASRSKPYEKVEQDIYAKALALEDAQGTRAVLVTTDLIGMARVVSDPICKRIEQEAKLPRSQILLSSSHAHSAPILNDGESGDYNVSSESKIDIQAYTRVLQDKVVEVAVRALSHLQPTRLSWSSGIAHIAMNRREFTDRGVILGVNPRGPVDRTVPVLRVDSIDGKLQAVLFGYACHNTTLTQTNYYLCGDYAGFAQAHIQAQHPGAQAMFMIGCGGDANPYPRGTMADARENGKTLGEEVCRVLKGTFRPIHGPLKCVFGEAALPLQSFDRAELTRMSTNGPGWQSGGAKALLAKMDRGEKAAATYQAPIAVWQFSSNLTLVALSQEVVVDYVSFIEQAIGPLRTWIAAYCNDVSGYLPSARILREGGYETRGLYTTQGWFAPDAQEVLIRRVRELAAQAGRSLP